MVICRKSIVSLFKRVRSTLCLFNGQMASRLVEKKEVLKSCNNVRRHVLVSPFRMGDKSLSSSQIILQQRRTSKASSGQFKWHTQIALWESLSLFWESKYVITVFTATCKGSFINDVTYHKLPFERGFRSFEKVTT